jgi:hypothetical protein
MVNTEELASKAIPEQWLGAIYSKRTPTDLAAMADGGFANFCSWLSALLEEGERKSQKNCLFC